MVLQGRIELPTSSLPMTRSTTELLQLGARDRRSWCLNVIALWCKRNLDAFYNLRYNRPMSEKKAQKTPAKELDRDARLKAALKANMAKRKAQKKARDVHEQEE